MLQTPSSFAAGDVQCCSRQAAVDVFGLAEHAVGSSLKKITRVSFPASLKDPQNGTP